MRPGQGAEQPSVLIGSIEQLHRVIHRCLENCKLTKHHWRRKIEKKKKHLKLNSGPWRLNPNIFYLFLHSPNCGDTVM